MSFKDALQMGCDFMDMNNPGEIYRISDYVRLKRFGLPTPGIKVVDAMTSEELGIVEENTLIEMFGDINELLGIDKD